MEDHRRRLRDLLIESISDYASSLTNGAINLDPMDSANSLVQTIFDCRSLYEPYLIAEGETMEFLSPHEKMVVLKREIIEWVIKLT